ncbi:tyrosine-type recombinase/integrase (plasmid) [Roseibium aggregatum]|uniref:tyrosine-type recombinase/integrase n=1 Tax=Roseibium aggregatum TaxID=187304 RepID=UPI001E603364|nr:tyrosine-type recombinase/integrase [Roseibium aggregatum]UES59928.1 tyrosine-type recombinase/integrase [Roseibium aggregatum]
MRKLTDKARDTRAEEEKAISNRVEHLDTLAAILPALAGSDRAEQLARLLTDEDIDTLRHLAREGMGENSLRALTSDFSYLEGWCLAATGNPLPWPAPAPLILKFIAHHLWDSDKKMSDPSHGMPDDVAVSLEARKLLRGPKSDRLRLPHAISTVQRRLASWSTLHRWRSLQGHFSDPDVRSAMRLAVRVADRPKTKKSRKAITADCLELLLATCDGTDYAAPSLMDIRDRALLLVGFASGGRRRSELSGMRFGQITWEEFLPLDPSDPESDLLPAASLRLGRTKTEESSDDNSVLLIGRSVDALKAWLEAARIQEGAVFRAIDQWGNLKTRALTPQSVNAIVKKRCALAGLDPQDFSAHGLRSGFLTEAANRDIPIQDAMLQSRHRSLAQASSYYSDAGRSRRRSARLLG